MSGKVLRDRSDEARERAREQVKAAKRAAYLQGWNARVDGLTEQQCHYTSDDPRFLITAWHHGFAEAGRGILIRIPGETNA